METTLFGGPPELGNMLKLANGQIGFMTIFAHPLFANVADIIPAMRFAADEILTNKGVWFTRAEQEKKKQLLKKGTGKGDGGAVSPRTQSPVGRKHSPDNAKERHGYFPSSPLRGRAESPGKGRRTSDTAHHRSSENTTPQIDSHQPSLAVAAAAVPQPANGWGRRPSASSNIKASMRPSGDRRRSGSAALNGEHVSKDYGFDGSHSGENEELNTSGPPGASISGEVSPEFQQARADKRRDNAVSMRAGTEAIPVEFLDESQSVDPGIPSKFKFATSKPNEPVREYDPEQEYSATNSGARASAPATNQDLNRPTKDSTDSSRPIRSAQSENTTSTTMRGGGEETVLTPSQSTGATSYTSDAHEGSTRNHNSFQAIRNRAASAPLQAQGPGLSPSFGMGSNSATSRESSKIDVHTAILRNGNGNESSGDRKVGSKTMGRRRSRLKLGLAFWKRNRSEKSIGDDERPNSQDSGRT